MDQAIQDYLRIEEAAIQASSAVAVSEAEVREFIRDTTEAVKVSMVLVDPQKLIDKNYQPTEAEVKGQFEKYKDKAAGYGQGDDAFGYQMPQATQVEFIEVNADALAKRQVLTDDEAYSYWLDHKAEFKPPATQPATSSAPATRPEQPKPYETFAQARADVRQKLLHEKAVREGTRLAADLIRQLSATWADQPATQPSGYRQPPASALDPALYEKLVAGLQGKYGAAVRYGRTILGDANEIGMNPQIGRARAYPDSNNSVYFRELAFMVAGLTKDQEADQAAQRLSRNVYETCGEPLKDYSGNVYIFRNIAVRPAQAPASVDQVRDKVVSDLRLIKARAEAERVARDLAERARKSGLKTAFQSDAELARKLESSALQQPDAFPRKRAMNMGRGIQMRDGYVPGVGFNPELSKLCFDLAGRVTTTQPTPVGVEQDKMSGRWVVVEYESTVPVTRDDYTKMREMARKYLLTNERLQFVMDWFSPESIKARGSWKPAHPEEEKAKPANGRTRRAVAF
jgi:hypothetical protein